MSKEKAYKRIKNMEGDSKTIQDVLYILKEEMPELCKENLNKYYISYDYNKGSDWGQTIVKAINSTKATEKAIQKLSKKHSATIRICEIYKI